MKKIKYFQKQTLQEDNKTNSIMIIDVLKSDIFPYRISLVIDVDGKKHEITNRELKLLIQEFENNEKLNKERYEKCANIL